jgi:prevent-host-death family protein
VSLTVNVQDAKANLSRLMAAAERGERVVIARRGKPAVVMAPVRQSGRRPMGIYPCQLSEQAAAESLGLA